MNILFLHRDFPGQFKYLIWALTKIPDCKVFFITEDKNIQINGVEKLVYEIPAEKIKQSDSFLDRCENAYNHAAAAAKLALELKKKGISIDLIYGFGQWGQNLFMKDVFPNVPLISYCEWFYNSSGADIGFDNRIHDEIKYGELRLKNAPALIGLYSSDVCVSPTEWQKKQFPKEFQDKIKIIHDGISSDVFKPNDDAKFLVKDKNIELTVKDEVITYTTRGMELYRGFPQFMEAVSKVLKNRPNAHVVIAGSDRAYYGPVLRDKTYKEHMLEKLKLDMNRVHFVDVLPTNEYLSLLQISSVHIYLTYPFVLSWSCMEAMSAGCCIVASDTPPVTEVIKDNYNGLLTDFYNTEQIAEKIWYALDNKDKMETIRANARQTIMEKYDIKITLPQYIDLINSLVIK